MNSRGFGFITSDDIDYFFHYTDYVPSDWKILVQQWLNSGKNLDVEFEPDKNSKDGPKAKNVKVIGDER